MATHRTNQLDNSRQCNAPNTLHSSIWWEQIIAYTEGRLITNMWNITSFFNHSLNILSQKSYFFEKFILQSTFLPKQLHLIELKLGCRGQLLPASLTYANTNTSPTSIFGYYSEWEICQRFVVWGNQYSKLSKDGKS